MRTSRSALLPSSALSLLLLLFVSAICCLGAFAQGGAQKIPIATAVDHDKDQPEKRAEWNIRGREAPSSTESAAALRLRAYQQKMAMRAQRAAKAKASKTGLATGSPTTSWVNFGPAPLVSDTDSYGTVSGRVTAIAVDPSDTTGNTVYAGAASGGVWKSTNAATSNAANVTWTAVTDQEASVVDGAVSVKPDGSVVLVGTGEPDNAIDSYYGVGILVRQTKVPPGT